MTRRRSFLRIVRRAGAMLAAGIACAYLLPTPGRFAAPALLAAGPRVADFSLESFLPGTEKVEVELAGGERLRGVFVPSDPGAPVVLHFLESSGSVTSPQGHRGYDALLADLADLGFASLALDFRGIGASDGSRSVTQLAEDVDAAWREAVRRAGSPDLVVLRGLSLGTLAAGLALEAGARPGGVVLVAPVDAASVVPRFAAHFYAEPLGWLARLLFRPVVDLDLAQVLADLDAPLFVVAPSEEFLLSNEKRTELQAAVAASGGAWIDADGDHIDAVHHAHGKCDPREARFLRSCFPGWPDEAARSRELLTRMPAELSTLCETDGRACARLATVAVTAPRECEGVVEALVRLDVGPERVVALLLARRLGRLPGGRDSDAEDWTALLDISDPAGELPYEMLDLLVSPCWQPGPRPPIGTGSACVDAFADVVREAELAVARGEPSTLVFLPTERDWNWGEPLGPIWRSMRQERHLGVVDARRQVLRMLLKGERVPDRVVPLARGFGLEAKECGKWRGIDLDWPVPPEWRDEVADGAPGMR